MGDSAYTPPVPTAGGIQPDDAENGMTGLAIPSAPSILANADNEMTGLAIPSVSTPPIAERDP